MIVLRTRGDICLSTQGRALQFDQWRIVHLAEFGICNFAEVSPSSFSKKSSNSGSDTPAPATAKQAKSRKARGEGEECAEVKQDLGETESEESNKENVTESTAEESLPADQTEAAEEKEFICSSCGASFVNLMSLNFHRNSCVPPEFYDEFPSDIFDSGDNRTRDRTGASEAGPRAGPRAGPITESCTNISGSEGDNTSSTTPSTRLYSSGGNNEPPPDESQHSNKIFNSSDERRGTAENRGREGNVKFQDELFVSSPAGEENLNNEAAKSGPELHSRAVTDRTAVDRQTPTSPRIRNNENYSETSELRITGGRDQDRPEEKSGESGENESDLPDERPSKLPKNTEEKISTGLARGDEFKKMPQRSAFKKGRLISEI